MILNNVEFWPVCHPCATPQIFRIFCPIYWRFSCWLLQPHAHRY